MEDDWREQEKRYLTKQKVTAMDFKDGKRVIAGSCPECGLSDYFEVGCYVEVTIAYEQVEKDFIADLGLVDLDDCMVSCGHCSVSIEDEQVTAKVIEDVKGAMDRAVCGVSHPDFDEKKFKTHMAELLNEGD
jgi:hypothetical protein